jgi:hypothetical protein
MLAFAHMPTGAAHNNNLEMKIGFVILASANTPMTGIGAQR